MKMVQPFSALIFVLAQAVAILISAAISIVQSLFMGYTAHALKVEVTLLSEKSVVVPGP